MKTFSAEHRACADIVSQSKTDHTCGSNFSQEGYEIFLESGRFSHFDQGALCDQMTVKFRTDCCFFHLITGKCFVLRNYVDIVWRQYGE